MPDDDFRQLANRAAAISRRAYAASDGDALDAAKCRYLALEHHFRERKRLRSLWRAEKITLDHLDVKRHEAGGAALGAAHGWLCHEHRELREQLVRAGDPDAVRDHVRDQVAAFNDRFMRQFMTPLHTRDRRWLRRLSRPRARRGIRTARTSRKRQHGARRSSRGSPPRGDKDPEPSDVARALGGRR